MAPQHLSRKFLIAMKIAQVFGLLHPSAADIDAKMLNVMAASNSGSLETIVMYSFLDKHIFTRVKEFPVPVKFLSLSSPGIECEFYLFYAGGCDAWKSRTVPFLAAEKAVFLPYFSTMSRVYKKRISVLSTEPKYRFFISAPSSHEEILHAFSSGLCQVVSISSTEINAPGDRFQNCSNREIVPAFKLFDYDPGSKGYFPQGHRYNVAVNPLVSIRPSFQEINKMPEALALLDAYRALNNTVLFDSFGYLEDVMSKNLDFVVMPAHSFILKSGHFFEYAHYSPSSSCFFTRRRTAVHITFMDSWQSLVWFLLSSFTSGATVVLFFRIRNLFPFNRRANALQSVLSFMVCTFLGRSPHVSSRNASAHRSLATSFWGLSMIFLGNYVQTSITAIRSIPSASRHVRSFGELERYMENCALVPCIPRTLFSFILMGSDGEVLEYIGSIDEAIGRCRAATGVQEHAWQCYENAARDTHAAFSSDCTDQEVAAAAQWDLVASDNLWSIPQVSLIHILHPLRYQHRRLLLTIAEHGLTAHYQNQGAVAHMNVDQNDEREQFQLYFFVLLVGCAVACAALAGEFLVHIYCKRNRRP